MKAKARMALDHNRENATIRAVAAAATAQDSTKLRTLAGTLGLARIRIDVEMREVTAGEVEAEPMARAEQIGGRE